MRPVAILGVGMTKFGGSENTQVEMFAEAAMDAVNSGSAKNILVCAADSRPAYANSMDEMTFGDGAAALLIGNQHTGVEIEDSYTRFNELMDVWRSDKDLFVRSGEDRFILGYGYGKVVPEAVSAALKSLDWRLRTSLRPPLTPPIRDS